MKMEECSRVGDMPWTAWLGLRLFLLLAVLSAGWMAGAGSAVALEPIVVDPRVDRIEITNKGDIWDNRGDSLQVETAAGLDGVVGRMDVKATTSGTNPNWIVFALTNRTDRHIERWLTADRYNSVGSGGVWPDLDARRISAVTPSIGFVPERVKSDRADVFRITLEPGQTITFVAELSSERFARIYLWKPLAYELKVRERQLFNGTLLGLTGLMAIFLTAIFAANHKAIFPTAALVAWCVLVYLCVDFGFFHKLFNLRPEDNAVYRAAGEAAIAASLVVFLFTFLRLRLGHGLLRMLFGVWILAQLALVAVAVVDPRLSATFARLSFLLIGGAGVAIIGFLAVRGQDRAMSLIPTWILFLVWIFATAVTLTGRMSGDIVVAGLAAGLVLVVVLIGFTVTQFAFRSLEPTYGAAPDEQQLRSLAVDGVGAATWEWSARRDEIKVSPLLEAQLGLNGGELSTKVEDFLLHVHTADRERFRLVLWSIQERAGGRLRLDFRLRHSDNSYRWYELEAASIESADRRNVRCVGLLRDVTDTKRTHERLLQDAVNCRVTGLPNKEIFLDRLSVASQRSKEDAEVRPTIIFIDLDRFRRINSQLGLVVGDSLLLTIARRLKRHLEPNDTLARIGGDQFAILLLKKQDPRELAALAERIRRSLRSPITIVAQEVVLTGSLGIAVYEGDGATAEDLLKGAEIAMYRAKRKGADRIEIFHPDMRLEGDVPQLDEQALRKALDAGQIEVHYQPIVYLPTEELAGFEAVLKWEHPKLKTVRHDAIVEIAEKSDLIRKVGSFLLLQALESAKSWQTLLPRSEAQLFASVNLSNCQIFKSEVVDEWRQILGRRIVPTHCIRLEVTEALAMENPERAVEMMRVLETSGTEIILDEFGAGFTSIPYLKRFPAETIKIDKSIVQAGTAGEGDGAAVLRSVASLADELGKRVIAEGVEIEDDVIFLRAIGCEYGQGLYYGEPMPKSEVVDLLQIIAKSERKLEAPVLFKTRPKQGKAKKKEQSQRQVDDIKPSSQTGGDEASRNVAAERANGTAQNSGLGNGASVNGSGADGGERDKAGRSRDVEDRPDRPPAARPSGEDAIKDVRRVLSNLPNVTVRPLDRSASADKNAHRDARGPAEQEPPAVPPSAPSKEAAKPVAAPPTPPAPPIPKVQPRDDRAGQNGASQSGNAVSGKASTDRPGAPSPKTDASRTSAPSPQPPPPPRPPSAPAASLAPPSVPPSSAPRIPQQPPQDARRDGEGSGSPQRSAGDGGASNPAAGSTEPRPNAATPGAAFNTPPVPPPAPPQPRAAETKPQLPPLAPQPFPSPAQKPSTERSDRSERTAPPNHAPQDRSLKPAATSDGPVPAQNSAPPTQPPPGPGVPHQSGSQAPRADAPPPVRNGTNGNGARPPAAAAGSNGALPPRGPTAPPPAAGSGPSGGDDPYAHLPPGIAASLARLAGKTGERKTGGGPVRDASDPNEVNRLQHKDRRKG